MKFNLLSNNERNVQIAIFVGIALISVDSFLLYLNIGSGQFWWTVVIGGIVVFWSTFSYYYIYVVEKIKLNPSWTVGNISFLILSVLWGILLIWLNLS